jgi:hypothetical protein
MLADLVHGEVYIYYFYQYDRPVVLNVKYELSHPRQPGALSKLFPEDVRKEAARRYNTARANLRYNKVVGIAWPVIVLSSLILLFIVCADYKKGLSFWLPAVIVLGPFAFIIRFLVNRKCKTAFCRDILTETLGNLVPLVISYTLAITLLIIMMLSGSSTGTVQIILMLGLPIIAGLVIHIAFLAPVCNRNYGRFILQRFPQVLITTNMGLAGISPVAMLLVNKSLNMTLLIPLSPLAVLTWWAIVVLGALIGGFIIFLFEYWEVKKGFRSWTILAGNDGGFSIPPFRKIWWWIPLSMVIVFAGLMTGVILLK